MPTNIKVKHTPGPWCVNGTAVEQGIDGMVYMIASVYGGDMDDRSEAEVEANARLIAAVPELLAALRAALPTLQRQYAEDGCRAYRELFEEARAAIAKAEGK